MLATSKENSPPTPLAPSPSPCKIESDLDASLSLPLVPSLRFHRQLNSFQPRTPQRHVERKTEKQNSLHPRPSNPIYTCEFSISALSSILIPPVYFVLGSPIANGSSETGDERVANVLACWD